MEFEHDGEKHDVLLMDDGTLDTVLKIDGHEVRLSQDFAADFRDPKDGSLDDESLVKLACETIDLGLVDD